MSRVNFLLGYLRKIFGDKTELQLLKKLEAQMVSEIKILTGAGQWHGLKDSLSVNASIY